jgi:hypothetical protein
MCINNNENNNSNNINNNNLYDDNYMNISDSESDSDSDSDTDPLFEEIFEKDEEFMDSDKVDQQLYIGFCEPLKKPNILLMEVVVSPKSFLEYSGDQIYSYLKHFVDPFKQFNGKLEIMKLDIIPSNGYYSVTLKTHWIRLIQRNWKRIFKRRQTLIRYRTFPPVQRVFELTGKYPAGLNILPSLQGMLYRL